MAFTHCLLLFVLCSLAAQVSVLPWSHLPLILGSKILERGLSCMRPSVLVFAVARSGVWEPVGSSSLQALLYTQFGAALG